MRDKTEEGDWESGHSTPCMRYLVACAFSGDGERPKEFKQGQDMVLLGFEIDGSVCYVEMGGQGVHRIQECK